MTITEKLHLIEELLDIEIDTLTEQTELSKISQWDSMTVIALIAMFDDVFGKIITPEKVKKYKTIEDITNEMNEVSS